jgi:hypothetical protein
MSPHEQADMDLESCFYLSITRIDRSIDLEWSLPSIHLEWELLLRRLEIDTKAQAPVTALTPATQT